MNFQRKPIKLLVVSTMFLLICVAVPGISGYASADLKLPNDADNQKVKDFCSSHLGNDATRLEKGACFEGYILGLYGRNKSTCNSDYKNHKSAINACRTVGYNGGLNNLAHVQQPKGQPGGGGAAGAGSGTADKCGGGDGIKTSINIGCRGEGNPIADAAFAIIRILSAGVGLVIIGSIVVGGVQYAASRGDPQATALAVGRIRSSLFALLLFIFGYAILNYVIPAGFLK